MKKQKDTPLDHEVMMDEPSFQDYLEKLESNEGSSHHSSVRVVTSLR